MIKYDEFFDNPEYKVRRSQITLKGGHIVYRFFCRKLDISNMLFFKREDNTYEPFMYDFVKSEEGKVSGKRIVENTIAYAFIQSIHYTEKTVVSNPKGGKEIKLGNLSILQWYFGIKIITNAVKYKKNRWDMEVSRQFGKTHLSARIAGFLPVYAPLYADLPNDRWQQILASYNDDSVKEIFGFKTKPLILKNIELFNKQYPSEPLVYGKHKGITYINDANKIEIRRVLFGEIEPHSYTVAISTNTIKDGKSADWMWCDESWRTNAKEFRRGILPFLSTGGDLLVSGISTSDTENLMYNIHFEEKKSIPMISDCFSTYNFLNIDYHKRAKNLRDMAEEEFEVSGIDSSESQTNYLLSWDVLDSGKFYTLELLRKNRNFSKTESLGVFDDIGKEYRVAGLDLATINDYCVLTIWDVYKTSRTYIDAYGRKSNKNVWKSKLRDIITYNLNRKPLSAENVSSMVAKDCNTNKIDMILIDGTSTQKTHNEWIYLKLRELNANTLVCPYDFSGQKNKVILMSYFEQALRAGLVVLGSEKELENNVTFKLLYIEMIKLYKGYENGKQNIQFKAKGKGNTDDHVMASALGVYCVPYIEFLEKQRKFIEINSYRYRAKLHKFKSSIIKNKKKTSIWMSIR